MKIRQGFVSNSSSSSFVLHRSEISDDQWMQLIHELTKFREENEDGIGEWGESAPNTFFVHKNYLCCQTYYVFDEIEKIMNKLNIPWSKTLDLDF